MNLNNVNTGWEKEAPTLAFIERKNLFTVPEGYFDTLEEHIHIALIADGLKLDDRQVWQVPDKYFDELSATIEARIFIEKLKEQVSIDGFSVQEGYFETLEQRITSRIKNEGIVKDSRPKISQIIPAWIKYAAAACLVAVLVSILVLNMKRNNLDSQIATIPDSEIVNYLELNADVGDTPIIVESLSRNVNLSDIGEDISTEELEKYVDTTL